MLIELRKWLFVGADSARQPVLIFHSQKQKLEVKGTANSMGIVCLYPQYNTADCSAQQKKPKVLYQHKREIHFKKGMNCVGCVPHPSPHVLLLEIFRFGLPL